MCECVCGCGVLPASLPAALLAFLTYLLGYSFHLKVHHRKFLCTHGRQKGNSNSPQHFAVPKSSIRLAMDIPATTCFMHAHPVRGLRDRRGVQQLNRHVGSDPMARCTTRALRMAPPCSRRADRDFERETDRRDARCVPTQRTRPARPRRTWLIASSPRHPEASGMRRGPSW